MREMPSPVPPPTPICPICPPPSASAGGSEKKLLDPGESKREVDACCFTAASLSRRRREEPKPLPLSARRTKTSLLGGCCWVGVQ